MNFITEISLADIIESNLKKDYQILIKFLVGLFLTQLAIERSFKFPPHPTSASALHGEIDFISARGSFCAPLFSADFMRIIRIMSNHGEHSCF